LRIIELEPTKPRLIRANGIGQDKGIVTVILGARRPATATVEHADLMLL
jgi:hypothetical protein